MSRSAHEACRRSFGDLKLVREGKKNTIAEDRQRLEEALRTSGIITAPIRKTRQE